MKKKALKDAGLKEVFEEAGVKLIPANPPQNRFPSYRAMD